MRLFEQQQLIDRVCWGALFAAFLQGRRIWKKSNSERRGKREERREKRDGSVPEGRDGGEKGRTLGETREERKEKREERDNHNQDERAEEGNSSVPEWCRKGSRLLGAKSMA